MLTVMQIRDKCVAVSPPKPWYLISDVCHSAWVWPTALKLGCITNFDMLFLMMEFISLVDEIQFMLISSCHFCVRCYSSNSMNKMEKCYLQVGPGWFPPWNSFDPSPLFFSNKLFKILNSPRTFIFAKFPFSYTERDKVLFHCNKTT